MKYREDLPDGYMLRWEGNLLRDRKTLLIVNLLSSGLFVLMTAFGIRRMLSMRPVPVLELGFREYFVWMVIVIIGSILQILLHAHAHAVFCGWVSRKTCVFGFRKMYVYAAGGGYFSRETFIAIELLPFILQALALWFLQLTLQPVFSAAAFIVQIVNVSGSAREFYTAFMLLLDPKARWVMDEGLVIRAYGKGSEFPV